MSGQSELARWCSRPVATPRCGDARRIRREPSAKASRWLIVQAPPVRTSNSMLECLVFGRRAALAAQAEPSVSSQVTQCYLASEEAPVTPELREDLWEKAGLIRDADGLASLTSSPHLLTSLVARSALARE